MGQALLFTPIAPSALQKRSNSGCAEAVADTSRPLLPKSRGTQRRTGHRDRATRSDSRSDAPSPPRSRSSYLTHPARLRTIGDASNGDPPALQVNEK